MNTELDPASPVTANAPPGFIRRHSVLFGAMLIFTLGIGVRYWIITQDRIGHLPDTNFFVAWTRSLTQDGLKGFYDATRFCDYPPLFLLIMWSIGHLASLTDAALSNEYLLRVLLKAPACIADLLIAITLLIEGRRLLGPRKALGAAALYFLNPVAVYNSAYWGQVDAIHTALLLLGVVFVSRQRWGAAGGAMGLALLEKFQSIALAPLILFEAYRCRRWRGVAYVLAGGVVVAVVTLLPFGLQGVLNDVLYRGYVGVLGQYNELSPSAYNIWQLSGLPNLADTAIPDVVVTAAAGDKVSFSADALPLLWLTWRHISLIVFTLAVALVLSLYSYRPSAIARSAAAGLLALAFFLFPTEMHERYAHPAIALSAIWAVTGPWRERAFVLLSAMLLLNMTEILHAGDIAPQIAATLLTIFVATLLWMAIDRGGPTTIEAFPPLSAESQPPPSRLIAWFRRLAYAGLAACVAGGVGFAYAAREAPAMAPPPGVTYLSDLVPLVTRQSWGTLRNDRTVLGGTMRLGDTIYRKGLGTHASSELVYKIPQGAQWFTAVVGVDRLAAAKGSAIAIVELDGKKAFETPVMNCLSQAAAIRIPLAGASRLTLRADPTPDGQSSDHVNWALAAFDSSD